MYVPPVSVTKSVSKRSCLFIGEVPLYCDLGPFERNFRFHGGNEEWKRMRDGDPAPWEAVRSSALRMAARRMELKHAEMPEEE